MSTQKLRQHRYIPATLRWTKGEWHNIEAFASIIKSLINPDLHIDSDSLHGVWYLTIAAKIETFAKLGTLDFLNELIIAIIE